MINPNARRETNCGVTDAPITPIVKIVNVSAGSNSDELAVDITSPLYPSLPI